METSNIYGTLDEAMTSILVSSSDDEAEGTCAAKKNFMEDTERYHKETRISETCEDSLQWWNTIRTVYPYLTKVACQYLCC